MNGIIEDIACGLIGYGVAKFTGNSNENAKSSTESINYDWPIYSVVEEWARHHGIYGRDNRFYKELLQIAENYRDPYND